MQVTSHHSVEELRTLARRERSAPQRTRLRIISLAMQGHTAPQIARALDASRRSVQEWVRRYNQRGLEGLVDRRGGNRRHLTPEQEQEIIAYVDRLAADPREGVRRGQDLRRWIEKQFQVLYSLNGIYELLHRLGYSCLMPRPRHAKADPAAQEAFKKTRRRRSKR